MVDILTSIMVTLIRACYEWSHNYVVAIVIFTLISKILLFPISIWTQKNSIAMVRMMPEINQLKIRYFGDKDRIAEETQLLYKRHHYHPLVSSVPMVLQIIILLGVMNAVSELLGKSQSSLINIPAESGGALLLMPIAAAVAAFLLGAAQNIINPLQKEQSKTEQWTTNGISIAISLVLGAFVSLGTGVYWISSNLLSIVVQIALNIVVPPRKHIDYTALEESRKELSALEALGKETNKENAKREKVDYKRFFSVANKHLVFYSEKSGFYNYYKALIDELLRTSNITIHYVSSDPQDQIFEIAKEQPRIRAYYIGEKRLITLMMKMDADIVVMTIPDLEKYHLKRSYIRNDIEYIFVGHGLGSINTEYREGALDHFDTIYLNNEQDRREIRAWEKYKGLPEKRLVEYGYPLMDDLLVQYKQLPDVQRNDKAQIVIAPSWQKDNIMETCIEQLIEELLKGNYRIVVRPHPQYTRHHKVELQRLQGKYADIEDVVFEIEFSSFESVYCSNLLVTDWSGVGFEFAFTTCKPVLFIHTPQKIMNPEYQKIGIPAFADRLRGEIGYDLYPEDLERVSEVAKELLDRTEEYQGKIDYIRKEERFNYGCAAKFGAADIINQLIKRKGS